MLVRTTERDLRGARVGVKTQQVEQAIRGLIEAGELGPGGRLPSERNLAQDLAAGRTTVRLVLMKLAAEGTIRSEQGRGYFVIANDEAGRVIVNGEAGEGQ
jgi:DNA-binding GntR family transcriptional regulator